MSKGREIKQRINSISKTKKITLAMKMVAAAKFKRSVNELIRSKTYSEKLYYLIQDLYKRLEKDDLPPLMKDNKINKEIVIVVSSDKGLCGGFNSYLFKAVNKYLESRNPENTELILIGNKVQQFFKKSQWTINQKLDHMFQDFSEDKIHNLLEDLVHQYENNEIGSVVLFYNEFISAIANKQIKKRIIPFNFEDDCKSDEHASEYIYEPNKSEVLELLLQKYIIFNVYQSLLNSEAAEEGSRMVAMDSASSNASEVIDDLKLLFNRSRQAAITTELTEIVAGAASLE